MSRRNRYKGKLPPFTALFRHTTKSKAWKALSVGAKAMFFVLQSLHNDNAQNAVFMSARHGVEMYGLGSNKNAIGVWLNELEHYGFIVKIQGAHLGASGKGKSATYRLTDRYHAGKPPTYDFQMWNGDLFEPKKRKVSDTEAARLKGLKKQNPVQRPWTDCPTGLDIRAGAEMAENGNKYPTPMDIKNDSECPRPTDISNSPSTEPAYEGKGNVLPLRPRKAHRRQWQTPRIWEQKPDGALIPLEEAEPLLMAA
jgi:hypothetical protein